MKKKYIIPYQYIIVGTAEVEAESLEEATNIVELDAPCPEPANMINPDPTEEIKKVRFSYLSDSFEVHSDDLDIVNDL
jgi:hypothetical protein